MHFSRAIFVLVTAGLLAGPVTASAQGPIARSAEAAVRATLAKEVPPSQTRSKAPAVVTGAVIGAVAALAITTWAAAVYGENEGGKFCANCLWQWSMLSVPVGAGLGAGVGLAVASIRSSAMPGGPVWPGRAGVMR
jgi:hypothetical protein